MEHLSWPILVALVLSGTYLFWLWMRPKDLAGEITKIKTRNYRLFGEVRAVAGAIADLPIPNNAAPGLTSSDRVLTKRLEFSQIIDEGAGNIVAASERARQTLFTMYPALPDLREDLRRALLRDLELVAVWEGVLLKRLQRHAQAIREQLLARDNSEEQVLRLFGKGEQALRLLGVIWPQTTP
jgi:uncharacterized protein YjeT (DUF2065 family)